MLFAGDPTWVDFIPGFYTGFSDTRPGMYLDRTNPTRSIPDYLRRQPPQAVTTTRQLATSENNSSGELGTDFDKRAGMRFCQAGSPPKRSETRLQHNSLALSLGWNLHSYIPTFWLASWPAGWPAGRLARRPAGRPAGQTAGWPASWPAGWPDGQPAALHPYMRNRQRD